MGAWGKRHCMVPLIGQERIGEGNVRKRALSSPLSRRPRAPMPHFRRRTHGADGIPEGPDCRG